MSPAADIPAARCPWPLALSLALAAALGSLLLSALSVWLDPVINKDGILYLRAARALSQGDWGTALDLYRWPLYPWLIAQVSQLTGTSLELSAHLLGAVFLALVAGLFVLLVREAGGGRAECVAAVLVILLMGSLGACRGQVVRDGGYLACSLLGLWLLLRHRRSPGWGTAVGWGLVMLLATAFRIEGIVLLVLLPLCLAWPLERRGLQLGLVPASLGLAVGLAWLLAPDSSALQTLLETRLTEPVQRLAHLGAAVVTDLQGRVELVQRTILPEYSADYAPAVLVMTVVVILGWEVTKALTPLYLVLLAHAAWARGFFPARQLRGAWGWLVALHLLILVVVLVPNLYLVGRFALALGLTLSLPVPFSLALLFRTWREGRGRSGLRPWLFPLLCLLLLAAGLDGLIDTGGSKHHLRAAGDWIQEQGIPPERVLSTDAILGWYAGCPDPDDLGWEETVALLSGAPWQHHDLLAIRIRRQHPERVEQLADLLGLAPVFQDQDRRGDTVLLFRR